MQHRERRFLRPGVAVALLLVFAFGLPACQQKPCPAPGTSLGSCDVLHGRLTECRSSQAFTFEGVESSILDFELRSDEGSIAAPTPKLLDPEGKVLDLGAFTETPEGAATTRVRDLVLLRSGTYQVTVQPTVASEVYYTFSYQLRFPPITDLKVNLKACEAHPVAISAPRGGMVTVQITPLAGSCTQAQINGVEDPWGGRALDTCRQLEGAPKPVVHHGQDGTYYLNFMAPIPGRYTILAAARPGHEGPAVIRADVRPTGSTRRAVLHPNRAPDDFGVAAPLKVSGSASDR